MAGGGEGFLADRVRSGDRTAFDEIHDSYTRRVRRYVQRRVARSDAEDVTQDVFLNVYRSLGSFRGESSLDAWIYGVARRTVAGRFKRRTLAITLMSDLSLLEERSVGGLRHDDHPESLLERDQRLKRLQGVCARLSDEQWRIFAMRHLEGCSIRQIAHRLDKSEDAVKSNLYRTRRAMLDR